MTRRGAWQSVFTLRLVVAALIGLAVFWTLRNTEWAERIEPLPLPETLARDGTHVAQLMLHRLGLKTRRAENLQTMPPPGATLVLSTPFWKLTDPDGQRLRQWVEAGGHLVADHVLLDEPPGDGNPAVSWWPFTRRQGGDEDRPRREEVCRVLHQDPVGTAPAFGDTRGFVTCLYRFSQLGHVQDATAIWGLRSDEHGQEVQRVALGHGRITVFSGAFHFDRQLVGKRFLEGADQPRLNNFSNRGLLEGDNAALLAALVDAQPGGEVWFVTRVQRPALPLWLWQHAAPVLLLAAGALLLALWRGGTRFGPPQAEPPARRRSLALQIEGLANFLGRRQPQALHTAALRALHETAATHVAGWPRLASAARTLALARATDLPEAELERAQQTHVKRDRVQWSDTLALLETARRRLVTHFVNHQHPHKNTPPRSPR